MRGGWLTTVYNIYRFVNQSKWSVFGGLQGARRCRARLSQAGPLIAWWAALLNAPSLLLPQEV